MTRWEYLRVCRNRREDTAEGLNAPARVTVLMTRSRNATHRPVSGSDGGVHWHMTVHIGEAVLRRVLL
jgi:hypothetical protein